MFLNANDISNHIFGFEKYVDFHIKRLNVQQNWHFNGKSMDGCRMSLIIWCCQIKISNVRWLSTEDYSGHWIHCSMFFPPRAKTQHTQITDSCTWLVMPPQKGGGGGGKEKINQHSWKQQQGKNRGKYTQRQQWSGVWGCLDYRNL